MRFEDIKYKKTIVAVLILFFIFFVLYLKTGFLDSGRIDERDLERWEYEGGAIVGGEEFVLDGDTKTCWYLIHGYTSTTAEMRGLAGRINEEFGDKVFVALLEGHNEVPSKILDLNLSYWHSQVLEEYDLIDAECGKVNLVGFSFGGALSTRLAEEREVNNLYLIAPYLFTTHRWYFGFRAETYIDLFGDLLVYTAKGDVGQINDPDGLKKHTAYLNMPFAPVKNSKDFFVEVEDNIGKVSAPVLLQHSTGDQTASVESSQFIYDGVSSEDKDLVWFERSNHILLADYDKEKVISNIINFERERR